MTDAERAREIAGECIWQRRDAATAPCDKLPSVSRCGPCARKDRILAALAAARAEEREAAGDRVTFFTDRIAHRWIAMPHNSSDGKARDRLLADVAAGRLDPVAALETIRGRKP